MINLKNLKNLTKDLSILYVEDDLYIQDMMVQYLEKFFNLVECASDGHEGLEKFKAKKFDIVITDLSMPNMSGIDMLLKIKEQNKEQDILITTAHSESEYMVEAIKIGIDGYIIKPFEFHQLNNELFKIAEKLKKFQENEDYKKYLNKMVEDKTSQLRDMILYQNDNYDKTLFSMVEMIEQRDTYTAGHSRRVAKYCQMIAKEMGYSDEECTLIHQAGILHDVGKIGTPDTILLNPKKLNDIEYKLIQEHVTVSYKLLNKIPMFKSFAEIVYSHHERYDGTGYPRNLKADNILPLARIMIVADSFDAMTTSRIYKSRKTIHEAFDELLLLSSKQFHPEVVEKAIIALKDIVIDDNITQLPKSKLEEERFAYFYKDTLSEAYNQNYLDVILLKNSYDLEYKKMEIFSIKNFSDYNKVYSWNEGNKILNKFSNIIYKNIFDGLLFRVFGDDFVVLYNEKINSKEIVKELDKIFIDKNLTYMIKHINLTRINISNVAEIEHI